MSTSICQTEHMPLGKCQGPDGKSHLSDTSLRKSLDTCLIISTTPVIRKRLEDLQYKDDDPL